MEQFLFVLAAVLFVVALALAVYERSIHSALVAGGLVALAVATAMAFNVFAETA